MTAELMKTNARDAAGSSCGQQTTQGAYVSNRAVQDRGRRLNQSHFRPMAEVSFLPSANILRPCRLLEGGGTSQYKLASYAIESRQHSHKIFRFSFPPKAPLNSRLWKNLCHLGIPKNKLTRRGCRSGRCQTKAYKYSSSNPLDPNDRIASNDEIQGNQYQENHDVESLLNSSSES